MQLMRDIILVLSSHGWEKLLEEENDLAAIDRLVEGFSFITRCSSRHQCH